jgi:SAM-dependent methyltransferase
MEILKTIDEVWQDLSKYLKSDRALEQGYSTGKYTKILAKYAKNVVAIDVSKEFFDIATENLKGINNVKLELMDAANMEFSDKSFDVLLNTSFHEFDLSGAVYSVDLELKRKILMEMMRVTNTIVFLEPSEDAVTNELFKVFNPNERHADRIRQSNALIDKVLPDNDFELIERGASYNEVIYNSLEELEEDVVGWWADIKVPANEEEKRLMIKNIDDILEKAGMLKDLKVIENVQYRVFQKKELV